MREKKALRRRGRGLMKQLAHGLGKLRTSARKLHSRPCKAAGDDDWSCARQGRECVASRSSWPPGSALRSGGPRVHPQEPGAGGRLGAARLRLPLARTAPATRARSAGRVARARQADATGLRRFERPAVADSARRFGRSGRLLREARRGRTLVLGAPKGTRGLAPGVMRARTWPDRQGRVVRGRLGDGGGREDGACTAVHVHHSDRARPGLSRSRTRTSSTTTSAATATACRTSSSTGWASARYAGLAARRRTITS